MIIRILSGAAAGLFCSSVSFFLADRLLRRRGRELQARKSEIRLFPLCLALCGSAVVLICGFSVKSLYYFIMLLIGGTVSITDMHFRIIPNDMLIALFVTALAFGIPRLFGFESFPEFSLKSSLLGLAVCFAIFMLPAALSKKVGAGDVKLAAVMGFALGLHNSLFAIVIMGVFVLAFTLLQRRTPGAGIFRTMIPMGPFIAASMLVVPLLLELSAAGGPAALISF